MKIPELQHAQPVTLEEMLHAREERAHTQQLLLAKHQATLVSFTLNIPGAYKQFPLAGQMFRHGVRLISRRLGEVLETLVQEANTGSTAFFAVAAPAAQVKEKMVSLEQALPVGRLFDIDVLDASGHILSRSELGYGPRACLLCHQPAADCGRSRRHPVEEVFLAAVKLMREDCDRRYCERIASTALRALLYEVATTPKPGLVDRANNGAHTDMDFFMFTDSAAALLPYFRQAAQAGLEYGTANPAALFQKVRWQGQLAEEEMTAATGGVNTHKGVIFSVGILCAAAGAVAREETPKKGAAAEGRLLKVAEALAAHALDDFKQIRGEKHPSTNGEHAFASHGIGGVRMEAANGFPHVCAHALPALRRWRGAGYTVNDAGLVALLHLLARVEDTNLVHRGGKEVLEEVHGHVQAYLEGDPAPEEAAKFLRELDSVFICRNLSPGGCADLLAVAYFLYLYSEDKTT